MIRRALTGAALALCFSVLAPTANAEPSPSKTNTTVTSEMAAQQPKEVTATVASETKAPIALTDEEMANVKGAGWIYILQPDGWHRTNIWWLWNVWIGPGPHPR